MKTASPQTGFTRVELFAIIAVIFLLSIVSHSASTNNRDRSKSTLCLSNMRHLIFAWQLYAGDHDGRLVPSCHGGDARGGSGAKQGRPSWASGWLDWNSSTDSTNNTFIREQRFARLNDYILTPRNVHKCPSDNYQSPLYRSRGWIRVRSVVMNGTIGEANQTTGPFETPYVVAPTEADIVRPDPAQSSVFLEEHPDSINDPLFFPPRSSQWIDVPGSFHEGASSVAFADGHVALHPWRSSIRNLPVRFNFSTPIPLSGDPDILWLRNSSQRSRD